MKKTEKILEVKIFVTTSRGVIEVYSNGDWVNPSVDEMVESFGLEPFNYGTILDGVGGPFIGFNTYNQNAPITLCGAFNDSNNFAIVNLHLGGDARGNYSRPYYIDNDDDLHHLFSQFSFLSIETDEGTYYRECDNGEAYFPFDTFDLDDLKEGNELSGEQLEELKWYQI